MRRFSIVLAPWFAICSACAGAMEPAPYPADEAAPQATAPAPRAAPTGPVIEAAPAWIGAAPAQTVIVHNAADSVWIGIWVATPEAAPSAARPPMSLALVVDTSGSMAGPKIENARLAATSLLEGVASGDVVAIDAFASTVRTIAPPTTIGPGTLGPLMSAVRGLEAMGGTNLYDGLRLGTAHAGASREHPLRRVIVISDGQANVGPSTPEALGALAAQGTEGGVQVSAIGVGIDYDERTLGELARRSSGRLYHLEEPSQLAGILDQEVRLLSTTVATGAYLEISAGSGVELQDAAFADARRDGGALRVPLGSLYAGQRREVLVRARVRGTPGSEPTLAKVRLVYEDRAAGGTWSAQSLALRGKLSDDPKAAAASSDARVQAMVARHDAAEAQRSAAEMMNKGRAQEAAVELEKAEQRVTAAAKRADDPAERARLTAQAARMSQTRDQFMKAEKKSYARQRSLSLQTYQYSFSDDGLAAPPAPPPSPPSAPTKR
ncbi:MAG: VWA domain-containing protein [Minicystis sp.]